jgi:hypothetical protein
MPHVIHSSAPALPGRAPRAPRQPSASMRAARAAVAAIIRAREDAGLYPDGRIRDMAAYAAHLRNGGKL